MLYQRAQDALLADALPIAERLLAEQGRPGSLGLLKNCRDAEGHAQLASRRTTRPSLRARALRCRLWRAGLVALIPVIAACALASWVTILNVFLSLWLPWPWSVGLASPASRRLRQRDLLSEILMSGPSRRFERTLGQIEYVPPTATSRGRRCCGRPWPWSGSPRSAPCAGTPSPSYSPGRSSPVPAPSTSMAARFGLSEKGPAMRRLVRLWVGQQDRAVFDGGNLCKPLLRMTYFDLRRFFHLFRRRQRMQLGLATPTWPRWPNTSRSAPRPWSSTWPRPARSTAWPRLRHPLRALRAIIAWTPSLQVLVEVQAGTSMRAPTSAIDLQRAYLERAREFVACASVTSLEAG